MKKHIIVFLLLIIIQIPIQAYECNWWVVPSSGDQTRRGGLTIGQNVVGPYMSDSRAYFGHMGFWNMDYEICFEISDSCVWFHSADTLETGESKTTVAGEQIVITNCGNCYIDFGLQGVRVDSCGWHFGYYEGFDRFVLLAIFDTNPTPPTTFSRAMDYIKEGSLAWSRGGCFGPEGHGLTLDGYFNLWFRFIAPLGISCSGYNVIVISLVGKPYLP